MNIYKRRFISRLGLMHMIATNLCVWLNILIMETAHEIFEGHHEKENSTFPPIESQHHTFENRSATTEVENDFLNPRTWDLSHTVSLCQRKDNIMSRLLKQSGPFLFPCTIEYR